MGLAGNIFWIVIGVLYIIYMLYKESPGETIACIIACVVILSFFLIIGALLNSLTGWWLVLFVVVLCVCVFLMAVYSVKLKADELDERNKRRYEYEEASHLIRNASHHSGREARTLCRRWLHLSGMSWEQKSLSAEF